jgi:succinate semialdehyde reductase
MQTVRIPKVINFGENALGETEYPKNALVVTTVPPALQEWVYRITCCMTK